MIEEFGGRPIKAGQSFSAAFIVGYFDTVDEMLAVNDRYRGHTAIRVDPSGWRLEKDQASVQAEATTEAFAREVERRSRRRSSTTTTSGCRRAPCMCRGGTPKPGRQAGELALPEQGWKLVWNQRSSPVLQNAVQDFQDYLDKSMGVRVEVEGRDSLEDWQSLSQMHRGRDARPAARMRDGAEGSQGL